MLLLLQPWVKVYTGEKNPTKHARKQRDNSGSSSNDNNNDDDNNPKKKGGGRTERNQETVNGSFCFAWLGFNCFLPFGRSEQSSRLSFTHSSNEGASEQTIINQKPNRERRLCLQRPVVCVRERGRRRQGAVDLLTQAWN